MKPLCFRSATFLLSSLEEVDVFLTKDNTIMREIALVGRSNVGKSSLINHLVKQNKIARVSARPGKTEMINYFNIDDQCVLVDLPGYGYAQRSYKKQILWSRAIDQYCRTRDSLILLLLLVDIRRDFSEEEGALLEWAHSKKKLVLIIFTKSDTISSGERDKKLKQKLFMMLSQKCVLYSIKDGFSRKNLIEAINSMLVHAN
jgi:GTP-binding protein